MTRKLCDDLCLTFDATRPSQPPLLLRAHRGLRGGPGDSLGCAGGRCLVGAGEGSRGALLRGVLGEAYRFD